MKQDRSRAIAKFKSKARRLMIDGRIDDMIRLLSITLRGASRPKRGEDVRHAL